MNIEKAIASFAFEGTPFYSEPFGCGLINRTYAVYCKFENDPPIRYMMQRINTHVFKDPEGLMDNIVSVTKFLQKQIAAEGGDPNRGTLNMTPTKDGKYMYTDEEGGCWRAYRFIEHAVSYQSVENPEIFREAARAFGDFQKKLSAFPADRLHETIPQFHDTAKRFRDFTAAVERNTSGRLALVEKEVAFIRAREADCSKIVDAIAAGDVPLRVTHNDTKLNNILMDPDTDRAVCILDLDTIMPGSALYDFGDSIRFGASSAAEDEKDLSKVYMKLDLFEKYVEGFMEGVDGRLTDGEKKLLAFSAKLLTLECGMRFLTDYLDGDVYFHTKYADHNLDRCRTQLKLVADMEEKMADMEAIVAKYC